MINMADREVGEHQLLGMYGRVVAPFLAFLGTLFLRGGSKEERKPAIRQSQRVEDPLWAWVGTGSRNTLEEIRLHGRLRN